MTIISVSHGAEVVGFLHQRGFPIPSPAALGTIGRRFRAAMRDYVANNDIPWIGFGKDDRKIDVVRPYLEAAAREGRSKVVAIGHAQEFQWVYAWCCQAGWRRRHGRWPQLSCGRQSPTRGRSRP